MPGTLTSPYTDNKSTPAPASNVGFKISKPGYDARTTAGNNYSFNSSWPSLPIVFETTITSPGASITQPHGLTFAPFSMVWYYYNDASGINNVCARLIPSVDKTNIYITTPSGATRLKVRAFNLDLAKDIDYTLAPGDTFNMPYDNNYGFKAVKAGKLITSTDMRDFTVHSRCQSPLILAVKTQDTIPSANLATGIGNVIQYTSQLNYPVWVYGFVRQASGKYVPAAYYSQSYPRTFTDGFKSYLGYGPGASTDNGATLVILRDPMFAATKVTVQY